ncbi:prenyltransferase/squalene oxidase repeat-containing protein [Sphaerisporangium aureirubrum]|uniref:Prenyltransferase/squalene oxidase repeat-containing protein n=1 Tax=Sphaerisporangium aureirubrum TaxID=1544736 RepID=A0ABW1NCF3_9ACTN
MPAIRPVDPLDPTASLRNAERWLRSVYKRTSDGAMGWGHHESEDPTEWGGTLDGIRGMTAMGEPANSSDLADAAQWLKSRQRPDGGFPARELEYSASEATAWVVIAFHGMGWNAGNDTCVRRAVDYLYRCVDSEGAAATTPADVGKPRTFPTALALWAFALQPDTERMCAKMISRLHKMQDPETRGWGVSFGATPNAATTAQVLYALCVAQGRSDADWVRGGAAYLLERQKAEGGWGNSHDEWFPTERPRIPSRCIHYGTAWALLALTQFPDDRECQLAAESAVRYLLGRQRKSGAWLFEEYDPVEFVWCTTQVMVALVEWNKVRRPSSATMEETGVRGAARRIARDLTSRGRDSFLYLAVGALAVAQFWGSIQPPLSELARFLRLDGAGIWTNLVSTVIWSCLALIIGWLVKRISRSTGDSKDKKV